MVSRKRVRDNTFPWIVLLSDVVQHEFKQSVSRLLERFACAKAWLTCLFCVIMMSR